MNELIEERRPIRVALHPEPQAEVIVGNWNVAVQTGPLGWVDADGVTHAL